MNYRRNLKKALEVILWFAEKEPGVDVHRILKLLFFADKYHLNRYGRPVVGDNYCALPFGPAPMSTYDILERKAELRRHLGIGEGDDFPFHVGPGPRKKHVSSVRKPDVRKLSETDVEALDWAYRTYGHLDFDTLSNLSHQHQAWQRGRNRAGTHMDYADFLEGDNTSPARQEALEELALFIKC